MKSLRTAAEQCKPVQQILKKQKDTGIWAANLLGTEPDKTLGIREAGTVFRYRQLLELGMRPTSRNLRLANRALFRVLSRDPDPDLLFEYKKQAKKNPALAEWARNLLRQGVVAALVHGGARKDPRVRGAAKRMANQTSEFLRSEIAEEPLVKSGGKYTLHPEAEPPTLFTLTMAAYMPDLRRERAGLLDRLMAFLSRPNPGAKYTIAVGDTNVKPTCQLLGDPLVLDNKGKPKDIPFALHWIELLARSGSLEFSETAQTALLNLLSDCDDDGIWSPKGLRSLPKSQTPFVNFAFPLQVDAKTSEQRKVDVTFRLSLIAKLCGWNLGYS